MKGMTWDEIYSAAEGAAFGQAELKAKDEARGQVRRLMIGSGEPDPENAESPEDAIEAYCDRFCIRFDEDGNIAGYDLPPEIAEAVYCQKDGEYLREDIVCLCEKVYEMKNVKDDTVERIAALYESDADCNVAYNDTLENAVMRVVGELKRKDDMER